MGTCRKAITIIKISIFTTATNPISRGDLDNEAMDCYSDLADEIVYVDGSGDLPDMNITKHTRTMFDKPANIKELHYTWPTEFNWTLISDQFQRGYDACTGDWVLHMDLDFLFHEKDFADIRKAFEMNNDQAALSFYKWQFIMPDRYNLKSRLVIAVNKGKFGDRIKFDGGGIQDLCQPSLDSRYLSPDDVREAQIPFYNYEKLTKTSDQVMDDCGRMDRAYYRHFGKYQLSEDGTDESAFNGYIRMCQGRLKKAGKPIKLEAHPKYIQETIKYLRPDQFGYSMFGLGEKADYYS